MVGDIFGKERAIFSLANANGASLTNGSAAVCSTADLDLRSGGNAPQDWSGVAELLCQWATVTGIAAGGFIGDFYLVPLIDGTSLPDIDLTAGSSYIQSQHRVGSFYASKIPTANTNARFASDEFYKGQPALYRPYLINRSGQTISANWTLRMVTARAQYS